MWYLIDTIYVQSLHIVPYHIIQSSIYESVPAIPISHGPWPFLCWFLSLLFKCETKSLVKRVIALPLGVGVQRWEQLAWNADETKISVDAVLKICRSQLWIAEPWTQWSLIQCESLNHHAETWFKKSYSCVGLLVIKVYGLSMAYAYLLPRCHFWVMFAFANVAESVASHCDVIIEMGPWASETQHRATHSCPLAPDCLKGYLSMSDWLSVRSWHERQPNMIWIWFKAHLPCRKHQSRAFMSSSLLKTTSVLMEVYSSKNVLRIIELFLVNVMICFVIAGEGVERKPALVLWLADDWFPPFSKGFSMVCSWHSLRFGPFSKGFCTISSDRCRVFLQFQFQYILMVSPATKKADLGGIDNQP